MIDYPIHTETFEQHGTTFLVELFPDHDAGAPWANQETFGTVSAWERRDKLPGERILNEDRSDKRFYDFQGAMKQARKEFSNTADAVRAVEQEFGYLRDWCNDRWSYVGVVVTRLDDDGEKTEESDALWGVEDSDGYPMQVAQEMAMGMVARNEEGK